MNHQLGVARAALAAGLLRPDPSLPPIKKDEMALFHALLDQAMAHCSPSNIEVFF